jgi:hypothetical protein
MFKYIVFFVIFLFCLACKNSNSISGLKDLDLMSNGMPIKIKAPEGSVVKSDDMGLVKEVTVKSEDNYYIQILSGQAYSSDIKVLKNRQMDNAISNKYFSRIVEEDDNGFIFEKKYPELNDLTIYDFGYIKLQGDYQYTFQAGLMSQFTLEQVKKMYKSVQ